jgi:hypothetical protein
MIDTIANKIQASAGGSIANAKTSAATTRTAPIDENMTAKVVIAPQWGFQSLGSRTIATPSVRFLGDFDEVRDPSSSPFPLPASPKERGSTIGGRPQLAATDT